MYSSKVYNKYYGADLKIPFHIESEPPLMVGLLT